MVLYGRRECITPWELEGDLGSLETEVDLPVEEVIDRMYIREQVLDVAAANIKRAQKIQSRSSNAKHCRNAFEVGEKSMKEESTVEYKTKITEKRPQVVWPL